MLWRAIGDRDGGWPWEYGLEYNMSAYSFCQAHFELPPNKIVFTFALSHCLQSYLNKKENSFIRAGEFQEIPWCKLISSIISVDYTISRRVANLLTMLRCAPLWESFSSTSCFCTFVFPHRFHFSELITRK